MSINTKAALLGDRAKPRGAFPHAKRAGDLVFVSGTSSRRPDNTFVGANVDEMGTVDLDIRQQTRAVIENIADILKYFYADLNDIVDITTFLRNMNDFGGYNETYSEIFDFDALPGPPSQSTSYPILTC